jgi:alpha-2-macroglobulin-like protein
MLEHLYGLLDEDEARELAAYLETPEGAAARLKAEAQRKRIGAAACIQFSNVQFAPPAPKEITPVRPAGERRVANTVQSIWMRWAVAACLLVVFGGLGGPAAYQFAAWYAQSSETESRRLAMNSSREELKRVEAEQQARKEQIRTEHRDAVAAQQAAEKAYGEALTSARKAIENKDFLVRLTGPERAIPGAPNEWKIETLNTKQQFAQPRKLEVIVKDQKDTELARETFDHPPTAPSLKLAASFWEKVKPGSDLYLEVIAYTDDNRKSVLAERVPLARPVYVTHLVTDKPLYKPGEVIRFRSLTLDRSTFFPPERDLHLQFRLKQPDGAMIPLDDGNGRLMIGLKPVIGPDGKPIRGIGTGEFEIADTMPGGEYVLEVVELVEAKDGRAAQEIVLDSRRFLINRYVPDVFEKKLEFDGKSYGPGDTVQARIEVTRTAGGPMKDARADVAASIDGKPPFFTEKGVRFQLVTNPTNRQVTAVYNVKFQLPADLFAGRGPKDKALNAILAVSIQDGSDAEPIVRPIPLVEKELRVEFFPEGGDLIEGIPSRVYFQVRTPSGKPADLKGTVTDGTNTVAEIATLTDPEQAGVNRGQGVFTFTPKAKTNYFLKLKNPAGIIEPTRDGFPLPEVKADGVVLTARDTVTEKGEPVRVRLQSPLGKVVHVGAYARGRLLGHQRVELAAGKPVDVAIQGDEAAGGVTRVTVFEEPKVAAGQRTTLIPRAERLIYRRPGEQLVLNVTPDKLRYGPGGKVSLDITALNEKDKPTPAILLVGVVNQSVIAMADNKTDRLMPTHFLLAGDVRNPGDLEHADFLLTDHPKAGVALDLLLGTQGWRRFAEQNVLPVDPAEREDVQRLMVANGKRTGAPVELFRLEEQRLAAEFQPKLEQMVVRVDSADRAMEQFRTVEEPQFASRLNVARNNTANAERAHTESAAELFQFETRVERIRNWALPLFVLGAIGLAVGGFAMMLARQGRERRRYVLGTATAVVLGLLATIGVVVTRGTSETERAWAKLGNENGRRYRDVGAPQQNAPPMKGLPAGDPDLERLPVPVRVEKEGPEVPRAPRKPRINLKIEADKQKLAGLPKKPDVQPKPGARNVGQLERQRVLREHLGDKLRHAEGVLAGPGAADVAAVVEQMQSASMPFIVREYAHQRDPSLGNLREDHTETVFWHPVLVLPGDGHTKVEFQLSDDIARYQILVSGHTTDGRIGAITKTIEARKPFTVDPKLPLEVSSNDVIDVPVRVVNDSDDRRAVTFTLAPSNLELEGAGVKTSDGQFKDTLDLQPNAKDRKVYRIRPTGLSGEANLTVTANSDPAAPSDGSVRSMRVVPDGFPIAGSYSDLLETRAAGSVELPKDLVKGTLKVRLEVYPTTLADLVKGLEGLLREPGGCFEQSSSANYPNTLVLDYLKQTNQSNPEATKHARELLDRGYAKLIAFETPDTPAKMKQGFEWFGAPDMAHEALTAYGLLQFKDMARVAAVDPKLIERTQAFLLSRRDGAGGFQRNAKAVDTFGGAPKHTTDAYIVWALVESDPDDAEKLDLQKEIAALKAETLKEDSRGGKDAYFVALTANVLLQRGDRETAVKLLDRLKEKHFKDGAVNGAETSITRSGGRDLQIETTAIAMLGWLRANDTKYAITIRNATRWISQQRGGAGGFGSTQSTILALKALILHAKKNAHPPESGEIKLLVAGKPIIAKRFSPADIETIAIDVDKAEELFVAGGKTDVEIVTDAKHAYPFALTFSATTRTPASAEKCAVALETKLGRVEANEGDTVPLKVTLQNRDKAGQGMVVAIVGVPAGMKVPTDLKQLTDLREKGVVSFFEVRGRELVLYWRELAPEQKVTLSVDLVCEVPGEYRGPASRAYLYYTADDKHWVEPLAIKIRPFAVAAEGTVAQK